MKIDILKNQERRSIRHLSASIFINLMYFDMKNRLQSERGGCVIGEIALLCMCSNSMASAHVTLK